MLMTLVTKVVNVKSGPLWRGTSGAGWNGGQGARSRDWAARGAGMSLLLTLNKPQSPGRAAGAPQAEPGRIIRAAAHPAAPLPPPHCPPLFSPRAPGDAPVFPFLPGRAGRCPGHRVTPGLCPRPVGWQSPGQAWLDGGWRQSCGMGMGDVGRGMRSKPAAESVPPGLTISSQWGMSVPGPV